MAIIIDLTAPHLESFYAKLEPVRTSIIRVATRLINYQIDSLSRDLGGKIPRLNKTPVLKFRKIRSRKRRLKQSTFSTVTGKVWAGANDIPAHYLGMVKKTSTGARAGKHHFIGGVVANSRSGIKTVKLLNRVTGKYEVAHIQIKQTQSMFRSASDSAEAKLEDQLIVAIKKEVKRLK